MDVSCQGIFAAKDRAPKPLTRTRRPNSLLFMEKRLFVVPFVLGLCLMGCSADEHAAKVGQDTPGSDKLTTGRVQSQIAKGMSGSQVAESLGSPNIVTTDENGREVWIYDRFATDVKASDSSGGVWLIFAFIGGSSGAATKSTRSLTVVIKFDENKKVRDVAYHSSSF